jgi:hypothetical protein
MARLVVCDFGGIRIDSMQWPLVTWSAHGLRTTDAELVEALDHVKELMEEVASGEKIFVLTDLSRSKAASASQRKVGAEFSARSAALQRRTVVGNAFVITSAVVRGVVTAVSWLRSSPVPTKVVATREEGLHFGLDLLEAHLSPLPPHLRALRDQMRRAAG